MTLDALIARLLKIESLHAGATTDGERVASEAARTRILERIAALDEEEIEMRFTLHSRWSQQLFTALARRYGLEPFRYRRQHATSLMLKIKQRFLDDTFWPQFQELNAELAKHLDEVATTVIEAAVHRDLSEAPERAAPKQLALPVS
jgi:tRNA nucleotidyltransferase (CCA-adding enzyme)